MISGTFLRDSLCVFSSKMDRVEANTDLLTNQYDNRLLSLEGAVMDKAAKDLVDQLQVSRANLLLAACYLLLAACYLLCSKGQLVLLTCSDWQPAGTGSQARGAGKGAAG